MTEAKKDDKPINETIYIPKQQAHQLGGFSCRTQGVIIYIDVGDKWMLVTLSW